MVDYINFDTECGVTGSYVLVSDYEALKAEHDRLQGIVAQTLQVKLVMSETIKELGDKFYALAVENAALKAAGNKMFLSAIGLMEDPDLEIDHARDIKDWERNKTPATDAALAAIRTNYMAEGAEIVASKAQVIYQERHKSGDFESAGKYLTTNKFANNIAAELREAK